MQLRCFVFRILSRGSFGAAGAARLSLDRRNLTGLEQAAQAGGPPTQRSRHDHRVAGHARAVRLTRRRLEALTPMSMVEIQADKDQLRAEFAMSTRRLEMSVEQLKAKTSSQLAEIGKKDFVRRTQLLKEPDGWFVDGRKFYCTGSLFAHWIPTLTTSPDDGRLYLVFVPRGAAGVTLTDDWDGFGQRVTGSGSVEFTRVPVQPQWVVPFTDSFERPTTIGPYAQIIHAALDLGIGQGAFKATLPFIREHSRPWIAAGVDSAAQDPLLLQEVGNVHVRLRAAQALLARAARFVDTAQQAPDEDSVAQASIAVAQAKALATSASVLAGSKLFELGGTSATQAQHGLDRYWRNARVHTLHDPVRWKYHAIGNYALNGVRPPRHGAL